MKIIYSPFREEEKFMIKQLWIEGSNAKQIAKILGYTEVAVRMQLKRILGKAGRLT